jgi:hypothetical protein
VAQAERQAGGEANGSGAKETKSGLAQMMGRVFLVVWFLGAVAVSLAGVLDNVPSPVLLSAGAVVPAGGFFGLYFLSSRFRQFVLGLNLRHVTLVEASRVTGFIFFLEYAWGRLPGLFAITTGATDFTVGITSLLVAYKLISKDGMAKPGVTHWHTLGMLAALTSGTMGILTSGTPLGLLAGGVTSQAMSAFPLNLVPLYLGPVALIFHLIALCILHKERATIPTAQFRIREPSLR